MIRIAVNGSQKIRNIFDALIALDNHSRGELKNGNNKKYNFLESTKHKR